MANSGPNTNGCQFFITEKAAPHLDGSYSIFGELISGLNIQDSISNVKKDSRDKPLENVTLIELKIIRKGKIAHQFDAAKVFDDHFIEIERLEKEKKIKTELSIKETLAKFEKQKAEAITLASGLQYFISEKGTEPKSAEPKEMLVNYAMYLENGKLIETNKLDLAEKFYIVNTKRKADNQYQPVTMNLSLETRMIAGLKEGIQQLNAGDKATLFIPYTLGYGENGSKSIPAKTNIVFEIEILKFL
jgi:peptidylprolyl isomerase